MKFSKSGRPVIKVSKDISDNVRLVRENFIAGLQGYAHEVFTTHEEAYKEQVTKAVEAGKPIKAHDKEKLDEAMTKLVQQAIAEAEAKDKAEADEKLVKQALEQADKAEASTDGTTEAEGHNKGKPNRKPKDKELVTA